MVWLRKRGIVFILMDYNGDEIIPAFEQTRNKKKVSEAHSELEEKIENLVCAGSC